MKTNIRNIHQLRTYLQVQRIMYLLFLMRIVASYKLRENERIGTQMVKTAISDQLSAFSKLSRSAQISVPLKAVIGTNAYVANYGIGIQGIDLTAVTPPRETAQANAIGGTITDSSYRAVSKVKNNILAIKNGVLSILSPQLSVIGQLSGLSWPHSVTGVEAFPIDLDNDGNIGIFEDQDGDAMTSAQETFDLALVSTADSIIIVNLNNPQSPEKIAEIPASVGKIIVNRGKRLAYASAGSSMYVISLKNPTGIGLIDNNNDLRDDRIIAAIEAAGFMDAVLDRDDLGRELLYLATYDGWMKILDLNSPAISVRSDVGKYIDELKFGNGTKSEKRYRVFIKLDSSINPNNLKCNEIKSTITEMKSTITVIDVNGNQVSGTGTYPSKAYINFIELDSLTCQSEESFVITNLPDGALGQSDFIPLYGGIGNKVKVDVPMLNLKIPQIPIEPVGVIVIAIDGLRQDVLYDSSETSYSDPEGCGSASCNVTIDETTLPGLSQILKDTGTVKLKDVTSIFPSITLASWASIFTGMMPGTTLDKDGKNIGGTGILGNEFFARDLSGLTDAEWEMILSMKDNPIGMVTLSDGAFKRNKLDHLSLIPLSKKWEDSPQNNLLQAETTVYEELNTNKEFIDYFNKRGGRSTVVVFNFYSRGAEEWVTVDLNNLTEFGLTYLFKIFSDADLLDKVPGFNAEEWLDNNLLNEDFDRNETPFPGVFVLYFAGLDHEAHFDGMSGYTEFFKNVTDNEIRDIVSWLRKYGEFDNKIFIITTDHGFTEMPDFGQITLYPGTPDERVVTPDTSCELKVERFNKRKVQDAEKTNNNLHIWELGEVLKSIGENGWAEYKVLAPKEIAELYEVPGDDGQSTELPYAATDSVKKANVIAAMNGPMTHVYLKGENGWQDKNPDIIELTKLAGYLKVYLKEGGVDLKRTDRNKFSRLLSSLDKILIRVNGEYKVFNGLDVSGNPITNELTTLTSTEYVKAVERIEGMNHPERSGDIVLIMKDDINDINQRFSTGVSCKSWHGSLNPSDSYVPLILAYPGGNRKELEPLIDNTEGCSASEGCDGNRRTTDLIIEIIKKQYE